MAGKLVRHYRTKHSSQDLPNGLLVRMPTMLPDELSTTLSQLASTAADRNSCIRPSRDAENADSDDTQDLEVAAAAAYKVF